MKSNLKQIILGCFLASLFFACGSNEQKATEEENCADVTVTDNTPNDDSELALLMRKMFLDADSIKQLIINDEGSISDEFITELERVHSAVPTDPEVKTPEFDAFNLSLVNQAKVVQAATDNKVDEFNQFVNRCVDCHQSFCPGPIKRINKLRIVNPI